MKKANILSALFLAFSAVSSHATVTLGIQADELRDASGTAIGATSLFLLVSSTANATFDAILEGSSTSVGSSLNAGDDRIVFRGDLQSSFANYGANGVLDVSAAGLDLASVAGWNQNDPLALLWFPTLNAGSAVIPAGTPYGLYTDATGIDGSAAWFTPADTQSVNFGFYTAAGANLATGSNLASAGNASLTVAGIPEPSRALLGMIGLTALGLRRRRR